MPDKRRTLRGLKAELGSHISGDELQFLLSWFIYVVMRYQTLMFVTSSVVYFTSLKYAKINTIYSPTLLLNLTCRCGTPLNLGCSWTNQSAHCQKATDHRADKIRAPVSGERFVRSQDAFLSFKDCFCVFCFTASGVTGHMARGWNLTNARGCISSCSGLLISWVDGEWCITSY